MPHVMIVLIPYINLLNFSWIDKKGLFFNNMEPLNYATITSVCKNGQGGKKRDHTRIKILQCSQPALRPVLS